MGRILDIYNETKPSKQCVIAYYNKELEQLVSNVKSFLEIGATTKSTVFWSKVFPEAKMVFCDINDAEGISICGDHQDPEIQRKLVDNGPYDVVCEDSDHSEKSQLNLFNLLWPITTQLYIMEDIRPTYLKIDALQKSLPFWTLKRFEFRRTLNPNAYIYSNIQLLYICKNEIKKFDPFISLNSTRRHR